MSGLTVRLTSTAVVGAAAGALAARDAASTANRQAMNGATLVFETVTAASSLLRDGSIYNHSERAVNQGSASAGTAWARRPGDDHLNPRPGRAFRCGRPPHGIE